MVRASLDAAVSEGGAVPPGTATASLEAWWKSASSLARRSAIRASRAAVSARQRAWRDWTSASRTPPTTGSPKPRRMSCDSVGVATCNGRAGA
eukprot:2660452-Amphidinium_carterae.1